jgi:hypothetical protein
MPLSALKRPSRCRVAGKRAGTPVNMRFRSLPAPANSLQPLVKGAVLANSMVHSHANELQRIHLDAL